MTAEACSNGAHSATRRLMGGIAQAMHARRGSLAQRVTGLLLGLLVAAAPTAKAESPASSANPAQPVDVVFVLDNSGSMRTNDPDFLTRRAVQKFAAALAADTMIDGRMALVLFDDQATLVQPLIAVDELVGANRLAGTLTALDFSGQRTNSPAGIERALYELRERGREDARGAIVFLSDGRIDTGDARNDLELARWLREDLASESDESGIRIFGIAFTDGADYQLMQALARRTRARYYRAFAAEDLAGVVDDVLATVDEPPVYDLAYLETPSALDPTAASPKGREAGDAASPASAAQDSSEPVRGPGLLGWLPFAVLLIGAGYLLARRRTRDLGSDANAAPPAQLLDPGGILGEAGHALPLAAGRTTIGRDPQNDIVLPDDTISSEHALIEVHDGRYWLVDLRSTNGTRHGRQRLAPDERVALKGGDHVRFADIDLMFVVEGYVPGGATVYLSSSTTPPSDWSMLASSTSAEPKPAQPSGEDELASEPGTAPDVVEDPAEDSDEELAARNLREPSADRDAPSGEVVFAQQRERIDPASVVDLDDELARPSDGDRDSARFAEQSGPDQAAREASVAGALERAEAALAAIEPARPQPAAAIPLPQRSAESSRPLALLPDPEPEPEPASEPEVLDPMDGPTAEVVPPQSDVEGESDFDSSTADSDPETLACESLRACLDYHLARVAEISPAFASFVDRAFDEELRSALPVAARDLLETAGESGRVEERAYTFERIRYLVCAVPTSMEGARDCFLETYGGFTRVLAEHLQAESFRADRCEILALLTFGIGESPWVSLTIVPDEGQDPRIDLLSYEFLTDSEREEIEPSVDAEISQSGLA